MKKTIFQLVATHQRLIVFFSTYADQDMSIRTRKQTVTKSDIKPENEKKVEEVEEIDKVGMMTYFSKKSLTELEDELELAKNGSHPYLLAYHKIFMERTKEALQRTEVSHAYSLQLIKEEYETNLARIQLETDQKLGEMRAEMEKDLEMLEKRTEMEYSSLEINKPTTSNVMEMNKKTLRGRSGVIIEPPTYFNANPKPQVPSAASFTNYLLDQSFIEEDLLSIGSNTSNNSKSHRIYDVQLQKLKFTYEGKVYKQGEELFVENSEYGKIPAKAETITDNVVFFKATQSWDTRQVHASLSDLCEGRVKVYKKKNS